MNTNSDKGQVAIGYIRVSTDLQASQGTSLSAQEALIRSWAGPKSLEPEIYTDEGLSGATAARPGLQAALDAACSQSCPLVVYSLSRLARSTKDAINIAERLDKAGADLVSLSESIDTTSAAGKMVFRMLAVLAEFERDLVSERTRAALAHKKARGERVSHEPAYGWRLEGDRVVVDVDEQRAVALIRRLSASGETPGAICRALSAHGHHPRGKRWHPETVRRILSRALPQNSRES